MPNAMFMQKLNTHVTTAFGFFSTAYTRTLRPASWAALSEALTRGPRPAPTTIITLGVQVRRNKKKQKEEVKDEKEEEVEEKKRLEE